MYSLRYECSSDPAGPAGAGAESRLRPQAGLRHLVRPGQAAALRPGLRDVVPAGPRRQGGRRAGRARGGAGPQAVRDHRGGHRRGPAVARRACPARAAPADGAVRQGRAGADAGPPGRPLPGYPARGAPAADARAHRPEGARRPDGHLAGRPRPVPPGGGPAVDRPHRGPAGHARPGGAPVSGATIIEARGVVKSFGQTPALRGATIAVGQGEIVAVMGPSGSGKSTLLHCLAGILVPDQGEVWFAGQRLDTLTETRRSEVRRDKFGFVFQSGQLVPELTAEENVALPLLLGGTRRAAALAEARAWLGRLGLDGLGRRRSGELSGGQAQRVALARGMVAEPRVLFADEPTGSLDSVSGEMVMSLMTRAAREQGTTVMLVTHDARVAAYADREVIVRDGTVRSLTGAAPAPGPAR